MGQLHYKGSWYFRYWHAGRLRKRGGLPSKRAAQEAEWADRRETGALGGRRVARRLTLRAAVQQYVTAGLDPRRPSAKDARRTLALICSRLGDRPLQAVEPGDLEVYARWRLQGGIKGATANRDLTYLSAFYSWAIREGLCDANPALGSKVKRQPEPWRPWVILTAGQRERLWALLPERERAKAQLLYHLGVRRGVVLGLRWEQVDLAGRTLTYHSKGKSNVIPLNKTALNLLRGLGPRPEGPVWPTRTDTTLRRAWAKARKALGVPGLRRHDLRVSFASELSRRGVDIKTVQSLLGHATPEMSLRYTVTSQAAMRKAVEKLDRESG